MTDFFLLHRNHNWSVPVPSFSACFLHFLASGIIKDEVSDPWRFCFLFCSCKTSLIQRSGRKELMGASGSETPSPKESLRQFRERNLEFLLNEELELIIRLSINCYQIGLDGQSDPKVEIPPEWNQVGLMGNQIPKLNFFQNEIRLELIDNQIPNLKFLRMTSDWTWWTNGSQIWNSSR